MAENVLVDAGYLVALLSKRDTHHPWSIAQSTRFPPPWGTCEAALSEAYHLVGGGASRIDALLERGSLVVPFELGRQLHAVLKLMQKYKDVPMSLADACLVRMTETVSDPILLTTDADFLVYRRLGRHVVPCVTP
ncbi:MAG: hypothetical protein IT522_05030 [Burkholderiales bacterium]|nr:hypothetical protein [Burkholderiales bacterium]